MANRTECPAWWMMVAPQQRTPDAQLMVVCVPHKRLPQVQGGDHSLCLRAFGHGAHTDARHAVIQLDVVVRVRGAHGEQVFRLSRPQHKRRKRGLAR